MFSDARFGTPLLFSLVVHTAIIEVTALLLSSDLIPGLEIAHAFNADSQECAGQSQRRAKTTGF